MVTNSFIILDIILAHDFLKFSVSVAVVTVLRFSPLVERKLSLRLFKAKKKQLARKEIAASERPCAGRVAGKRTHVLAVS